ncbi:MAG TPA: TonB family protein [Longimicrobiaceae bacterium]|nr:TonB family protein [Longimicrobiaceae bacterium]
MFNTLIASKPKRKSLLNSRTVAASIVAHALLLGGATYAAVNAPQKVRTTEEQVTFLEIEPETPAPEPEEPPPPPEPEEPEPEQPAVVEQPEQVYKEPEAEPEPAPAEPIAKGFQELAPPADVPDRLPEVNPSAPPVRAEDFSGVGVAGGVATGAAGGEARNAAKDPPRSDEGDAPSGPVDVNVVEERPKLANGSEMERVMQRLYPPLLRESGVTGQAVLSFVIDATGRVETATVEVVSATHEAFGQASVQAAEKFRFRPARIGGRPVRVAITMPISWTLDRG